MSSKELADKIIDRIADLMSEEDPESIVKALIGIAHGLADQTLGPTKASNLILNCAVAACGTGADIEH
jgi:hypothetical protein